MEGTEYKAARGVKVAGVGEDPPEKLAHPIALQPGLDKKGVGVRDHHQLKVLLMALHIAEEVQDAGVGWDPLYSRLEGFLGHALICQVGHYLR